MNPDHLQFLTTVLVHLSDATIDWAEVAKIRGVSRKDNCVTGFKNVIKRYGIEYQNNKFVPIANFDASSIVASGATISSPARTPATPRKRKAKQANDDEGETNPKSTPKSTKKKSKVAQEEVEDEGEGGVGEK